MTEKELRPLLKRREWTEIELKKSKDALARSVYSSICAFLNRRGGHVILGANNDGSIEGVSQESLQSQLDILAKDLNNPQIINPVCHIEFEPVDIDGKKVIYGFVPESSEAHTYKGVYYDRNQDGDFELRSTQQIFDLLVRKGKAGYTENRVFPYLTMDDFEPGIFDVVRANARLQRADHPWLTMTDEEILESSGMRLKDPQTGKEGYTLAAALVLGSEKTIASVLPHHKTDALCRINDTFLYDDRDVIRCNLIRSFDRLCAFAAKHLPEAPFMDGVQRISLRDKILREVFLNLLIHREMSNSYPATFTIYKDTMVAENWNIPYHSALVKLSDLTPHPKNPTIARFFANMGYVEELGVGRRTLLKYGPVYFDGREAEISEENVFRITIPYKPTIMPADGTINDTKNVTKKLTDRQRVIYESLPFGDTENVTKNVTKNNSVTTSLLAEKYGKDPRTIKRDLKVLQELGLIEHVGPSNGGYWKRIK